MALETLRGITEIDGFKTLRNLTEGNGEKAVYEIDGERGECEWKDFADVRGKAPIGIHDGSNMISFKIQDGPIKEVGVNGCQVLSMIKCARIIIAGLSENFPCKENQTTLDHLDLAIGAQEERTARREREGSEGYSMEREDA